MKTKGSYFVEHYMHEWISVSNIEINYDLIKILHPYIDLLKSIKLYIPKSKLMHHDLGGIKTLFDAISIRLDSSIVPELFASIQNLCNYEEQPVILPIYESFRSLSL